MTTCSTPEELYAYSVGKLDLARMEALSPHLESCPSCQSSLCSADLGADPLVARLRCLANHGPAGDESSLQALLSRAHAVMSAGRGAAGENEPASIPMSEKLDQYEILEQIGQGGMGTVYRARHAQLGKIVALKVLRSDHLGVEARQRFHREIAALGRLDDPHVVRATDAREADGIPFLVMEYVDGIDLHRLARGRRLSIADACELARQAAAGLQHVHELGLVHRDVKPSNLMLARVRHAPAAARSDRDFDAVVKILDLGLARLQMTSSRGDQLTSPGQVMGSLDYLAPEQANDAGLVDIRADVYSLGCTLYELLSGSPPFRGEKYEPRVRKLAAHLLEPVPPIRELRGEVPEALVAVLDRMLAKQPECRYATPAEVVAALAPFAAGSNLEALVAAACGAAPPREAAPTSQAACPRTGKPAVLATNVRQPTRARSRSGKALLLGGASVIVAVCLLVAIAPRRTPLRPEVSPPAEKGTTPLPPMPKGWIDVLVWEKPNAPFRHLHDAGVLPLKPNDRVRVEVVLDRPAFVYVVWIASNGRALPVYPWTDWNWKARPASETPIDEGYYPGIKTYFEMDKGEPGLETLLLLARETPLPEDVDLAATFAGLPAQKREPDAAVVWFENGRIVTAEPTRAPRLIDPRENNDPVVVVQALLREKLQPHFRYTRAVSFSVTGR